MRENKEEDQGERKEKKLYKYYKKGYVKLIGDICTDLCKIYCSGCFLFGSPPLCHSCLLPDCEKVKKYARIAMSIIHELGLAYFELRKILDDKKGKINFIDSEITMVEYKMTYRELKNEIKDEYY